jgi:hypothetical protein
MASKTAPTNPPMKIARCQRSRKMISPPRAFSAG